MESGKANVDVTVNILAKPFMTSLAILSLLRESRQHINKLWLQFEPVGSKYDRITSECIFEFLTEKNIVPCEASQSHIWVDKDTAEMDRMNDPAFRYGIRYQYAYEKSASRFLFTIHNDVYFMKDLLGALLANIGEAFAIGQLGQCWNCPAANSYLTHRLMGREPCRPDTYQNFRPTTAELCALYDQAEKDGIFVRPYGREGFAGDFTEQPWPLPECRINEWACLINLDLARQKGVFPFGGYKDCAGHRLDIGVAWFRDLHQKGLIAKHFDIKPYMKHWIGTGNKSAQRYAQQEDNALRILHKHFPAYIEWLERKKGIKLSS